MRIQSGALRQFRNIPSLAVEFHPDVNLIYGKNAQGKTSLLEGIAYLSVGGSHRATYDRELISHHCDFATIQGTVDSFQREISLEAQINRVRRRKLQKNQVNAKSIQEFSDVFHTVLFCPEDLTLVRGAPLLRRRFLDRSIGQLRPKYQVALEEYKKLYQHKSKILRCPSDNLQRTLPDFNLRMAQIGAMLVHYRSHFIKRLQETVPPIHHEFSGETETIEISYKTVSTVTDPLAGERILFQQILDHQESHYHAEIASGNVLTGPHKDDIIFQVEGQNAKVFASQGQTRTLALSLKLGEREIFYQETGEYPVLLLDDVLSELDRKRQEFVLNRIGTGQVFITSCEDESFLSLKQGAKFHMSEGILTSSS